MSLMQFIEGWTYSFEYTNHRGEVGTRRVKFKALEHGANSWYAEPQFFLSGVDLSKHERRQFAIARINLLSVRRVHGG